MTLMQVWFGAVPQVVSVHVAEHTPAWQNGAVVGQTLPHVPQFIGFDIVSVHWFVPAQRIWPAWQAQAPVVQSSPAPQAVPHAPQFASSFWPSTQPVGQVSEPTAHEQLPFVQVCGATHTLPQAPQLLGSLCVLAQTPLHGA